MDPRFYLGGSNYLEYQLRNHNNDCFARGGRSDHAVGHHIGFFSRRLSNGIFMPIRKGARVAESGPVSVVHRLRRPTVDETGCPTLATFLFLWLGWDRELILCFVVLAFLFLPRSVSGNWTIS